MSADSKDSGTASSEDGDRSTHHRLELVDREHSSGGGNAVDTGSEWSESRPDSDPESPECLYSEPRPPPHLLHPAYQHHAHQHPHSHPLHHANSRFHSATSSPPPTPSLHQTDATSPIIKPRIWSLADMATKENDVRTSISSSSVYSTGKMVQSLAGRAAAAAAALPHPANYAAARHHEFYRSLYGPHLASATTSELLESYSRTLGASLGSANGNGAATPPFTSVAAVMAAAAAAATSSSSAAAPFDLAVSAGASGGASSTTSSSESSPTEAPPSLNLSNSTLKSESRAS